MRFCAAFLALGCALFAVGCGESGDAGGEAQSLFLGPPEGGEGEMFSCDRELGEDVQKVFQQITAMGKQGKLKKILQAPFTLHSTMLEYIENERLDSWQLEVVGLDCAVGPETTNLRRSPESSAPR